MGVWTIFINGISRKYKTIGLDRKLDMNSPTEFRAKIESSSDIKFMDRVEIKRDNVNEWVGYIEEAETVWESDGVYLNVSGRDNSLILWKKYTEDFSNFVEKTQGFFGSVNFSELFKLMLRTPKSDLTDTNANTSFPNNKEGWGLDYTTNLLTCSAYRTGLGDPNWVKYRRRGYGWKNTGNAVISTPATLTVDAVYNNQWYYVGSPPYLDTDDTANYVSTALTDYDDVSEFTFQNLSSSALTINSIYLQINYSFGTSILGGSGTVWVYIYDPTLDYYQSVAILTGYNTGWVSKIIDLTGTLSSVSDINNCRIKFVNKTTDIGSIYAMCNVSYAKLSVSYSYSSTGASGQSIDDYFKINFNKANVCGIYIESRNENDSYPRNYKIISEQNVLLPIAGTGWTEVDPSSHINPNIDNTSITFTSSPVEVAYNYKDYGVGGLTSFGHKTNIKINSAYRADYLNTVYAITNNIESRYSLEANNRDFFAIDVVNDGTYTYLRFYMRQGGVGTTQYSSYLTLGTLYYLRVTKQATSINIKVFSDPTMTADKMLDDKTFTISAISFRYLFNCLTYGAEQWLTLFTDGFDSDTYLVPPWDALSLLYVIPTLSTSQAHTGTKSVKFNTDGADEQSWLLKNLSPNIDDELQYTAWFYLGAGPSSDAITTTLPVNGFDWSIQEVGWGATGAANFIDSDDSDSSFISITNDPVFLGNEYGKFEFANLNPKYTAANLPTLHMHMKARLYDGVSGHATNMSIRPRISLDSGVTWHNLTGDPQFTFDAGTYVDKEVDISSVVSRYGLNVNNVWVKFEWCGVAGSTGSGYGGLDITYCYIEVIGTGYFGGVTLMQIYNSGKYSGPWYSPTYWTIAGLALKPSNYGWWYAYLYGYDDTHNYWEESYAWDAVFDGGWRGFRINCHIGAGSGWATLQYYFSGAWHTWYTKSSISNSGYGSMNKVRLGSTCWNGGYVTGGVYADDVEILGKTSIGATNTTIQSNEKTSTEIVSEVTNNTYRDIIHSWSPVEIDNLVIQITADDASHDWGISQIYIYKPEDTKIKPYLDGTTEPTEPTPYTYVGGPYIKAYNIQDVFTDAIGPINIGKQRLLDAIYYIVQKAYEESDEVYNPYEWWMSLDDDNTLNIATQKGSDKSSTITFVRGTNLGSCTRKQFINDTAQRVYIAGQGEQKRQQNNSLWVQTQDGMNDVRTFYEEIEQDKTSVADVNGNPAIANIIGKVYLGRNGFKRDQITITVNKDTYATMAYDVGDTVWIEDSFTNLAGAYRIWNIHKDIDENGEKIEITLGYPKYKYEDEIQAIYKQLKALGVVGVTTPDWTAEGYDSSKINATAISVQSLWSLYASNGETVAAASTDTSWSTTIGGGTFVSSNGQTMQITGKTTGSTVDCTMKYIQYNSVGEDAAVSLLTDPHFVADIKLVETGSGWNIGDIFDIGMTNGSTMSGVNFRITKIGGGLFICYMRYQLPDGSNGIKAIRYLNPNVKYRLEIITDSATNIVTFNVYTLNSAGEESEQYPVSGIAQITYGLNFTVNPLLMLLCNNPASGTYVAKANIYSFKLENTVWS